MNDLPIILGAVVDFMLHLCERKNPLVVGKDYPNSKVIEEFEEWANTRQIDLSNIDKQQWIQMCNSGKLGNG